jgi:hypothetical protein
MNLRTQAAAEVRVAAVRRPKRFSNGYYRAEASDAEVRGRLGSITELRVHGVSCAPPLGHVPTLILE